MEAINQTFQKSPYAELGLGLATFGVARLLGGSLATSFAFGSAAAVSVKWLQGRHSLQTAQQRIGDLSNQLESSERLNVDLSNARLVELERMWENRDSEFQELKETAEIRREAILDGERQLRDKDGELKQLKAELSTKKGDQNVQKLKEKLEEREETNSLLTDKLEEAMSALREANAQIAKNKQSLAEPYGSEAIADDSELRKKLVSKEAEIRRLNEQVRHAKKETQYLVHYMKKHGLQPPGLN